MVETIYFKGLDLNIKLTPFINIIGTSSSGKTTLLRNMINQNKLSEVFIDGASVNTLDIEFLRKNIAAVLNSFVFKTNYVNEELLYYQKVIGIEDETAYKNLKKFAKFFDIESILETQINYLSKNEQAYIKILSILIFNPSILGIDDMLTFLDFNQKMKIIKYAKNNKISILNVTTNPEELLLGTDIIILDSYHAIIYDKTKNVLSNEKILNKIGMNPPFIVEMSSNLNYYDLLSKKFFTDDSLIGELWK